ncbi:MAG: hypothetical protein KDA60_13680 [Planctomycetales bacterium]|nr:hypothetical protein [Planctomycetales bacterium]
MPVASSAIAYRRLRAPREPNQSLVIPPEDQIPALILQNQTLRDHAVGGHSAGPSTDLSWAELADQARRELLGATQSFANRLAGYVPAEKPLWMPTTVAMRPLIMTGHQPALYHPGVWFKIELLGRIAAGQRATAINVIIDNDLVGAPQIAVPSGPAKSPDVTTLTFDHEFAARRELVAYEEYRPVLTSEFLDFGNRVSKQIEPWVANPILKQFWPWLCHSLQQGATWPEAATLARQLCEQRLSFYTAEWPVVNVPWSDVCDTPAFRCYFLHLARQADLLVDCYNRAVCEYRHVHRLRGRTHPVPDLRRHESWIELPFWIWTTTAPERTAVWVREETDRLLLRRGGEGGVTWELPLDNDEAVVQLGAMRADGVKIRSRAITTTLYARLFLSDLFIHGIGGAKYDQITDQITSRFFSLEPPQFVTATATRLLPLPRPAVDHDSLRSLEGLLRDLRFHPELHFDAVAPEMADQFAHAKAQKLDLLANQPLQGPRKEWHDSLETINETLRGCLTERVEELRQQRARLQTQLRVYDRLASREFSALLFPMVRDPSNCG